MKAEFGVEAELTPGGGGVFDVVVDGTRVFCKHDVDRFPEAGEVVRAIQSTRG